MKLARARTVIGFADIRYRLLGYALVSAALACGAHGAAPRNRSSLDRTRAQRKANAPTALRAARPAAAQVGELALLDLAARFGPYLSRAAIWVAGQPLAVNRDFDFGVAMTMDSGPGLAAAKRRKENQALVERFAEVEAIDPERLLDTLCSTREVDCARLPGPKLPVYGLLFGATEARLQVVVELPTGDAQPAIYVAVGAAQPVAAYLEPGALLAAFTAALAQLPAVLANNSSPTTARGACNVGGRAKLEGQLVASGKQYSLLFVDAPARRVLCPRDALVAEQ